MIEYIFFRLITEIFRFIPFFLIYPLADLVGSLLYIAGYRKKVILNNLKNSFPSKSDTEIKKIVRKYYIHLTDIVLESLKGYTMTAKQFQKRYKLKNPEIDKKYYDEKKNVIYVGGHYGNWEWGTQATPFILKHKVIILYKPLKNKFIDKYVKKRRERFGVKMISIKMAGRSFKQFKEPYCVIMVADQNPSNPDKAIWIRFLNRDTPVLQGTEAYAKLHNMPVIFFDTRKVKRGRYELTLIPIAENPRQLPKGKITELFMKNLENTIIKKPEYWLWSHRRWKHKKRHNISNAKQNT